MKVKLDSLNDQILEVTKLFQGFCLEAQKTGKHTNKTLRGLDIRLTALQVNVDSIQHFITSIMQKSELERQRQAIRNVEHIFDSTLPGTFTIEMLIGYGVIVNEAIIAIRKSNNQLGHNEDDILERLRQSMQYIQLAIDEFETGGNRKARYQYIEAARKGLKGVLSHWPVHILSSDEIQVTFYTDIIPTAYCNQLSAQDYPLVQVAIDNSHPASTDVSLSISASIEDYSDLAQESITVAKGTRKEIPLLPVLTHGTLATLNDMRKVTLHYSVKQTAPETRTLKEGTQQLHLMAHNRALIGIRDENKKIQDLTKYLAAWVTPNRSEIAIVQREAIRYGPEAFVGYQEGTAESVREQVKAIFSALKYKGLIYVATAFNWEMHPGYIAQKMRLPRECLAEGMCANCLDGAVLFASLLELSGIAPVLVLIPNYAFVGWRTQPEGKQYEFLDPTMIGTSDFEQAQNDARQRYEKALAEGDFERTLFHKDGFARLIDVAQHKQAGIYALE